MRNLTKKVIINFFRDKGAYFGIVGSVSIATSAIVSFLLHSSLDPSFNIISYAVSDLGTGPFIPSIIFSIGLIIASFCQGPLYFSLIKYFQKKEVSVLLIKITALSSLISMISHNILSLVPFERDISILFLTHGTTSVSHYILGSFAFILYGFIERLNVKVSKILVVISFITGALYGMLWMGYLIFFIFGLPVEYSNYTLQWFALTGVILWSLLHGIFLNKAKKRDLVNSPL